ncbi:MAG: hypothetical protein A2036_00460 [Omnitrophica bacterium GWA2_50_21]|nr:MAG: hypothetical protein A2036_00460 [Omnitrophica bacterium GWA2_50_21]
MSPGQNLNVLFIEDNLEYASIIKERLQSENSPLLRVIHHDCLSAAFKALAKKKSDVILLDLMLPDSQGLKTFTQVQESFPDIPIVVLTSVDEETLGHEAVQGGAQDYLIKGEVDGKMLARILAFAVERKRLQLQLLELSLKDTLTDLYNRRGFLTLAGQQHKLAVRNKRSFLLFFMDIDGLKQINDRFGHLAGDETLQHFANALKSVFRSSDILGRIGGDEFTAMAVDLSPENESLIMARMLDKLEEHNKKTNAPYTLSFSVGSASFLPNAPDSLENLLKKADNQMYIKKQSEPAD